MAICDRYLDFGKGVKNIKLREVDCGITIDTYAVFQNGPVVTPNSVPIELHTHFIEQFAWKRASTHPAMMVSLNKANLRNA
jgi:hypothetical protein